MNDAFRLQLVKAAIEGYPKFRASDFELQLPRPTYTIHTLDRLKESYPSHHFSLIIGADNWVLFPRWKEAERLLVENNILIYPRQGYDIDTSTLPQNVRLVNSPQLEVSSTFIRQALQEGKDVRYFLHPSTHRYFSF